MSHLEIFCGTGGVGKTTLATSRALNLALQNKKVLLITIDPARRLKQILNLKEDDENLGKVELVELKNIHSEWNQLPHTFHSLLMSPLPTLRRILTDIHLEDELEKNRILNIFAKPFGGMNELLSLIEIDHHIESKQFDFIVLDTPPGDHFVDFLNNCQKIQDFFDQKFIEVIHTMTNTNKAFSLMNKIFQGTINKLLSYLEKVTGKSFILDFLKTLEIVYKLKRPFLKTLQFQKNYLHQYEKTKWFWVTSVEHDKMQETMSIRQNKIKLIHQQNYLLINKWTKSYWDEVILSPQDELLRALKESMQKKEKDIERMAEGKFKQILKFKEILDLAPQNQVKHLTEEWQGLDHN